MSSSAKPMKVIQVGAGLLAVSTALLMRVEGQTWVDALYLSTMTVTTVGYGDLCPTTGFGKIVCSCLALLGIGYFGIVVEVFHQIRKESEGKMLANLGVTGTLGMLTSTICLGVLLCWYLQDKGLPLVKQGDGGTSVMNAAYWSIVTSTSIGYGDLYPATDNGKLAVSAFALWSMGAVAAVTDLTSDWLKKKFF